MSEGKRIIKLIKDNKGYFSCEIPIFKEQWLEILRNKAITTPSLMKVLLSFYFMPKHKATCYQCAEEYGNSINTYNTGISSFGRAVSKYFDSFEIIDDTGNVHFWPIPVGKGKEIKVNGNIQFEWQLREDLVEALEETVIEKAISSYIADFDKYWNLEKYKWRAIKWFQEKWDINSPEFPIMLDIATSKSENLLSSRNSFPRGMIVEMAKADTNAVKEMFIALYDETQPLKNRVADFMKHSEEIRKKYNPGNWNMHYQTTNSISVYLWLRYPDKYYIYKYGEFKEVDDKLGLGYEFKRNGEPSEMVKGFKMYSLLNSFLSKNQEAKDVIDSHITEDSSLYPDPQLKTATGDLGYYISRRYKSLKSTLYTKSESSMNPFISEAKSVLENKKNIILQGAPGTGKTYNTAALALSVIDGNVPSKHHEVMARYKQLCDENRIGFTTFHQSMDYEDFIEGIKPVHSEGNVTYEIEDGIFKKLCIAAKFTSLNDNVEKPFVLIIDEINRGNVSKIFGELITLIERDKRIGENHPITLTLPYSKQSDFGVPSNLYIIGTMNTTDRSTGTIDYALRRRFAFLTVPSQKEIIDIEKGKHLFENVKEFIERYRFADMDVEDLMIGHSYFMAEDDDELLLKMRFEIIPLIKEYIKDGILRVSREEQNKYFSAWLNLEKINDNDSGTSEN